MAVTQKYPILRWLAPVVAVAAVVAGATIPLAGADPTLPPKTADEVLVAVQEADVDAFSGTVETTTDLGLPALPVGDSAVTALLSGTHTVRVWQSGDEKQRASLVGDGTETTVVRNGDDVWQWSSASKTAKHLTVPEHDDTATPQHPDTPKTPQEAAEQVLAAIEPSTAVSVSGTEKVAGRAAYLLVLEPKSDSTLVGKVTLAVDGDTGAPLRVQVWADGANSPAISVGFTQVSFTAPDDSVFDFTPPSGATVEEVEPGQKPAPEAKPEHAAPTVVGEGWDQVVVATLPAGAEQSTTDPTWEQFRAQLPRVQGNGWQGSVLTSALVTVVLTDDGRVAAGLVPTDVVVAAIS